MTNALSDPILIFLGCQLLAAIGWAVKVQTRLAALELEGKHLAHQHDTLVANGIRLERKLEEVHTTQQVMAETLKAIAAKLEAK